MEHLGVVFVLLTLGYILGVRTALLVTKQPPRAYEDGAAESISVVPVIVLHRVPGR